MGKYFPFNRKTQAVAVMLAASPLSVMAQTQPAAPQGASLEEVVVTGSLIRGTPVDAALPVQVITAEELQKEGDPSALEFVKTLTASGPTTGEAYYFGGSNLTNNVRFNLRGIGSDKTLTLFNGRRAFDNSAVYPSSVIQRVEVLKDGAAVTYGADATGGVVNLITRDRYDGFQVSSSYKHYDGTDGEWKMSALGGFSGDKSSVVFAAEWDHRSELDSGERGFTSLPYGVNPAPWSTLTNLAGWVPRTPLADSPTYDDDPLNDAVEEWGTALGLVPDYTQESCEAVGGVFVNSFTCAYGYIPYYNLVEENDLYRVFGQLTTEIGERSEFVMRALYAQNKSPHQYGSPSQPVIRGPSRATGATFQLYVPVSNPYVAEFMDRTGWSSNPFAAFTGGFTPITYRAFAHGGNDVFASGDNHSTPNRNETKYWHINAGFNGEFGPEIAYDVGVTYNQFTSTNSAPDIIGFRLQEALNGFGGPNCNAVDQNPDRFGTQNPSAAGQNGCLWYNPFASNFAGQPTLGLSNPNYIPGSENPAELVRWLYNDREAEDNHYDITFDAVFSAFTPLELPGGPIAVGAGFQWRDQKNRETVSDPLFNGRTPCDWPGQDPANPDDDGAFTGCTPDEPGPFLFFGTNIPDATEQEQHSYFAEVNLPILDSLYTTAAVRHEEFSGNLSATVYKFSGKWQMLDSIALRGSYGTNYQAPGPEIIPGEVTNGVNSYTVAGGNWRGAQTITETDIEPETATVWSAGLIGQFQFDNGHDLQVIVDYFDIETEDELGLLASANDIADAVFSVAPDNEDDPLLADCSHPLVGRVTFNGACVQNVTSADDFSSIRTAFGNGPGQHTTGFDIQVDYDFPLFAGTMGLGVTATKLEKFEFSETVLDGFVLDPGDDRLGTLNFATIANAAAEWRGNFNINYSQGDHNVRAVLNYVSGVDDERFLNDDGTINLDAPGLAPAGRQPGTTDPFAASFYGIIGDDWKSVDLHYLWSMPWATLGFSVLNVADEDPPASRQEMGYDPRIGNPLGRQFEVSFRKEF